MLAVFGQVFPGEAELLVDFVIGFLPFPCQRIVVEEVVGDEVHAAHEFFISRLM